MARKNRYNTFSEPSKVSPFPNQVGIYARISLPDGDDVSESIANQIHLAMNYIQDSQDLVHVKTYVDDGYSGLNFDEVR